MQIRKLLAGGLAATMAGATLAFGAIAASSDLGDFVTTGTGGSLSSPRIVIGSSAGSATEYPKDVAAAGDVAAAMAGYATETVSIAGGSTTSVSGGADVATTNKKIYFRSKLNRARSTLTSSQLPTLLASGTASVDLSGTYSYDQYLNIGERQTEFDRDNGVFSGVDDDPQLYIDMGTSASGTPLYNFTVVFSKALNVTHSDVQGGTIKIANVEYTIGANSQSGTAGAAADSKLVLLGGAGSTVVDEGGSATISLNDVEHTVEVSSVADTSTAVITVDGKLKEVTEGNTYSITGDQGTVDVYVKGVYYAGATGTGTSQVEVTIGASKLTLENHQTAKSGTSETTVQGTHVYITGDDSGISKLVISVSGKDSSNNYILAGGSFWDPVYNSFKVAFHGMTPQLDSSDRDTITIDNSGTTGVTAAFTDYRGYSETFQFIYNGTGNPDLNQSSTKAIHVLEGETVSLNDYVLMAPEQESDFGHIMQLTAMTNIDGSEPRFTLTDALSDTTMTFYFSGSAANDAFTKTFYIDGQTYYGYNVTGTSKMNFTWGESTASSGATGTKTTVFPLVKLAGGEYITFIKNQTLGTASQNVTDGSTHILELPTGDLNISLYDNRVYVNTTAFNTTVTEDTEEIAEYAGGQVSWDIGLTHHAQMDGGANYTLISWVSPQTTYLGTENNRNLVASFVLQEADNTTTTKDAIITGIDYSSTDGIRVEQITGGITGVSDGETRTTNSNINDYLNIYGTKITWATVSESQGKVDILYPDDQGVITVGFGLNPTFSTAATGGSYDAAYKITNPVTLLDNEVTTTSSLAYDLILIGGPCANTAVAELLADDGVTCSNWAYSTGIIKEVANAFGSGKKALIIAGTTADDTRSLAGQVLDGTLSYEA